MPKEITFGHLLISDILPGYDGKTELTNKYVKSQFYKMARENPEQYVKSILNFKKYGDMISTLHHNMTIGLEDVAPMKGIKIPENLSLMDKLKYIKEKSLEHKGNMAAMVKSGARGKDYQLASSVLTPVVAQDAFGNILPIEIKRGVSAGLSPAEYWAKAIEKRHQVAESRTAVEEPGDVSKMLVNTMHDQVVTIDDCGTLGGVEMGTSDPNIIDRYLAVAVDKYPRNTLLTEEIVRNLSPKHKTVIVRSPMTCKARRGVCQKCMGLYYNGQHFPVGMNVGVRSATVLSEPLTQMVLSSKHGVRSAAAGAVGGLKKIRQLLEIPQSFMAKAVVSSQDGIVKDIEKLPFGGYNIHTDHDIYYVSSGLEPNVKKGQKIRKGDILSTGIPYPPEILKHKGLGEARKFMVNQIYDTYKDSGIDIDKRHIELLVKSHLNFAKIWNKDIHPAVIPGDIINYNHLEDILSHNSETIPTRNAEGRILASFILDYPAGTIVTREMIDKILKNKIDKIPVSKTKRIEIEYVMKPITHTPLLNPDVIPKLAYRYLKSTLLDIPAIGGESSKEHHVTQFVSGRMVTNNK